MGAGVWGRAPWGGVVGRGGGVTWRGVTWRGVVWGERGVAGARAGGVAGRGGHGRAWLGVVGAGRGWDGAGRAVYISDLGVGSELLKLRAEDLRLWLQTPPSPHLCFSLVLPGLLCGRRQRQA